MKSHQNVDHNIKYPDQRSKDIHILTNLLKTCNTLLTICTTINIKF